MKTYLCDCKFTGESRFLKARNWDEAQDACFEDDLILVGEHVPLTEEQARAPLWLTHGETTQ